MTKIAILGPGQMGDALAKGFLAKGHPVMRGSRDPETLAAWVKAATACPIDALCQLWCAPGMLRNDWAPAHAWLSLPE